MRPIKFRAWSKKIGWTKDGKPCEPEMETNGFVIYPNGKVEFPQGGWDLGGFYDDVILMQYTGLKDKNGVEIYEGDIVEWKYINVWQKNEVKWVEGRFVATMSAFKDDLNEMQNISLISKLDCEVIGNIYENPELLAESEQDSE